MDALSRARFPPSSLSPTSSTRMYGIPLTFYPPPPLFTHSRMDVLPLDRYPPSLPTSSSVPLAAVAAPLACAKDPQRPLVDLVDLTSPTSTETRTTLDSTLVTSTAVPVPTTTTSAPTLMATTPVSLKRARSQQPKSSAIKKRTREFEFKVGQIVRLRARKKTKYVVVATHSDVLAITLASEPESRPQAVGAEVFEPIEDEVSKDVDLETEVFGLLVISLKLSDIELREELERIVDKVRSLGRFFKGVGQHAANWISMLDSKCKKRKLAAEMKKVIDTLLPADNPTIDPHDEFQHPLPQANEPEPMDEAIKAQIMESCANDPPEIKQIVSFLLNKSLWYRCCFDVLAVLRRAYVLLTSNRENQAFSQLGAGQTQVGKTTLKFVYVLLASSLDCSVFVVTPNSANCADLLKKMSAMAEGNPFDLKIMGATGQRTVRVMEESLQSNATGKTAYVCLFSKAQLGYVQKAADKVEDRRKMVFLLDEADDFLKHRYENTLNMQEVVLAELLEDYAHLYVEITASPIPLIVKRLDICTLSGSETMDPADFIVLKGGTNYTGVNRLSPPKDEEGREIYLMPGSLTWRNCYFNTETVLNFIDRAIAQTNSLVVCATNPRLRTEGGVFDAGRELCEFYMEEGVLIFSMTGEGIAYRLQKPGDIPSKGRFTALPKKVTVGEQSENATIGWAIDHVVNKYKWEGAVIVIGYTMLNRGVSFHCRTRVPTHLIVNMKPGQSSEKVLQALGRGTGNFKDQLSAGVVEVLTTRAELELVKNYQAFLDAFYEELARSEGNIKRSFRYATMRAPILTVCGNRSVGHRNYEAKGIVEETLPDCILLQSFDTLSAATPYAFIRCFLEHGVPLPKTGNERRDFAEAWEEEQEKRIEILSKRYLEDIGDVESLDSEDEDESSSVAE